MQKPKLSENQVEFTDSQVGMEEGVNYAAIIVGCQVNGMAADDNKDNTTLVVATVPFSRYTRDGEDEIREDEWVQRLCSSRAFVNAGCITRADKRTAMENSTVFAVSWEAAGQAEGANGRKYTRKRWNARRV